MKVEKWKNKVLKKTGIPGEEEIHFA